MNTLLFENKAILALGWMLVHSLWQITLLAGLIRLLWWIFPGREARLRYALSLGALAIVPLAAALTFGHYYKKYDQITVLASTQVVAQVVPIREPGEFTNRSVDVAGDNSTTTGVAVESYKPRFSFDPYLPYLVCLWLLGALLLSLRLAGSWWYMDRVKRKGLSAISPEWQIRFQALIQQMGLSRKIRLSFSKIVEEPLTLGHLKPVILFPVALINQLSPAQVEAVLLHELAHVRRMDYLVNWLQSIVELLFFYHPAVWWLSREVRQSREHCCDDLAIRRGGASPVQYARTLTQLAALSFTPKNTIAMSVNGIHQSFSARIHRLFANGKTERDWRKPVLSLTFCFLLFSFLVLSKSNLFAGKDAAMTSSPPPDENVLAIEELADLPQKTEAEKAEPAEASQIVARGAQKDPILSINPILGNSPIALPKNLILHARISGEFQPPVSVQQSPLYIVDGREIPDDAPFEILPSDIGFDYKVLLPDSEEGKAFGIKGRHGVVRVTTRAGNWSGGKPYRPIEIKEYEETRKEVFVMVDGRLLGREEKLTINGLTVHWIAGLHGIGIYDKEGQLVYGQHTPKALEKRTFSLELENGYTLVSGIYACDNTISLRVFNTLAGNGSTLKETLNLQLTDQIFPDTKQQRAYCDNKITFKTGIDPEEQELYPEPLFIIDGKVIHPAAGYTPCQPGDLKQVKFLLPAAAMALYGRKAIFGAAILKSGEKKWTGGKPYKSLRESLKISADHPDVEPFEENSHFFLDGRAASKETFYKHNIYSFFEGTIMHPMVGAIYASYEEGGLEAIRKKVRDTGIAYELTPGWVVVEYFRSCENTIPLVALCSPLTSKVPAERIAEQNKVPWEKLAVDCDGKSLIDDSEIPSVTGKRIDNRSIADPIGQQIESSLRVSPVPFSEETHISFTLPEKARTKVSVYDLQGQLIQVLVDETLEGSLHQVSWDARSLPAGIYMLRIEAGDEVVIRQLSKQ